MKTSKIFLKNSTKTLIDNNLFNFIYMFYRIANLYRQFISGENFNLVIWLFLIFSIIFLPLFVFLITRASFTSLFDYSNTGQIGDTIGGIEQK